MVAGFGMHVNDYSVCSTVSLLSIFHLCRWKLLLCYLNCALSSQIFTSVVALKTKFELQKKKKKKRKRIMFYFMSSNFDMFLSNV